MEGERVAAHLRDASPWFPVSLWWWTIRLAIPALLFVMMLAFLLTELQAPYGSYPDWAIYAGWAFVMLPLLAAASLNKRCGAWEHNALETP